MGSFRFGDSLRRLRFNLSVFHLLAVSIQAQDCCHKLELALETMVVGRKNSIRL